MYEFFSLVGTFLIVAVGILSVVAADFWIAAHYGLIAFGVSCLLEAALAFAAIEKYA